jgi:hypothetical protein
MSRVIFRNSSENTRNLELMVSSFNGVESAIFLKTEDRFIYTFEFDVMIPVHDQNSGI